MTRNSIISADNVGNANTYIDQYYAGIMEMNMVSLQNNVISMNVVREADGDNSGGVLDTIKKLIDSVLQFFKGVMNKFLQKINDIRVSLSYKRFLTQKNDLSKLPDDYLSKITVSLYPYFGEQVNDTKIFLLSIFNGTIGVANINTGDQVFKTGWKDTEEFNQKLDKKLYSNVKLANGVNDTLLNRAKALYTGGGAPYQYNGAKAIVNALIDYCSTYTTNVKDEIKKEGDGLIDRLEKLQASLKTYNVGESFSLVDNDMNTINESFMIVDEIVNWSTMLEAKVNNQAPADKFNNPPLKTAENEPPKNGAVTSAASNNNNPANANANNEKITAIRNEIKYIRGCMSIMTVRMTVAESCFLQGANVLNKIYNDAVKNNVITKTENAAPEENNNNDNTGNQQGSVTR